MKIIIETKYNKVSVEVPYEDLTAIEVIEQLFGPVMLGLGYHEETLLKHLGEVDIYNVSRIDDEETQD